MEDRDKLNRRSFIEKVSVLGAGSLLVSSQAHAMLNQTDVKLTILHTNDWHSRIDPFPADGGPLQGLGGAAARAALINRIRKEEEHVLLLDAGDVFQGTAYFNYFKGELEFKLMSSMQYDCMTLGNHDFDNGIEGLIKQMPHASFAFVNCNYDFTKTELHQKVQPYKIFRKGKLKIGVLGVGIQLHGLVPDHLFGNIIYQDPVWHANSIAKELKFTHQCDLIICLSHLGYQYENDRISDVLLARQSKHIDLIIGGHTHTFLSDAVKGKNADGKEVTINQVGWGGVNLGRIDYVFNPFAGKGLHKGATSIELGF